MRIQEAMIDPLIGAVSEELTTSSSGEATLSIRLKLSYMPEDCNILPVLPAVASGLLTRPVIKQV
jgi:hypothetical protein